MAKENYFLRGFLFCIHSILTPALLLKFMLEPLVGHSPSTVALPNITVPIKVCGRFVNTKGAKVTFTQALKKQEF